MGFSNVPSGKSLPDDFNVVIEIPTGSSVKYEIDKESDAIFVDRFTGVSMHYPCNYGYIPQTLCGDGDAIDVLVFTPQPVQVGSVVRCRPIAILRMTDEAGTDSKIIAVPHDKITTLYSHIHSMSDFPEIVAAQITHFFEHYKDLEKGKWMKVEGWGDIEEAKKEIMDSVAMYSKQA